MQTSTTPTYDTETVRAIISRAAGSPYTPQEIRDLARQGRPLHPAKTGRGRYSVTRTKRVAEQFALRRLAAELGRSNPRLLDNSHARACPECGELAVEWDGKRVCEQGHQSALSASH